MSACGKHHGQVLARPDKSTVTTTPASRASQYLISQNIKYSNTYAT